jgi:hypothetical protein
MNVSPGLPNDIAVRRRAHGGSAATDAPVRLQRGLDRPRDPESSGSLGCLQECLGELVDSLLMKKATPMIDG